MLLRSLAVLAALVCLVPDAGAQQQNCPNGRCPLQQAPQLGHPFGPSVIVPPAAPTLPARSAVKNLPAATTSPRQSAPAANFLWKHVPGKGDGWIEDMGDKYDWGLDAAGTWTWLANAKPAAKPQAKPAGPIELPEDTPLFGLGSGELRRKAAYAILRTRAIDKLVLDGMTLPDGTTRHLTRAQARRLVNDRVTDDVITGGAVGLGAPKVGLGDGSFLRWIWEHREAIIAFILRIVSLFSEDAEIGFVPVGSGGYACYAIVEGAVILFLPA